MQNRLLGIISIFLGLITVGFLAASFMRILTFAAVSGVAVGLFSAQLLLVGIDLWLQQRKLSSVFALVPAVMGLCFAVALFF